MEQKSKDNEQELSKGRISSITELLGHKVLEITVKKGELYHPIRFRFNSSRPEIFIGNEIKYELHDDSLMYVKRLCNLGDKKQRVYCGLR